MNKVTNAGSVAEQGEHGEIDDNGYKTIKKRVGGGFKYVKVKLDVPKNDQRSPKSAEQISLPLYNHNDEATDDNDEKQDIENSEKAMKDEKEKENHMVCFTQK